MVGNTAQDSARNFDKCMVRKLNNEGGTYEKHMVLHVHEFFSEHFYDGPVQLRFKFNNREYTFTGRVDPNFMVHDFIQDEVLNLYPNVNTLKSMIRDRYFPSFNKWGAACLNALGGDIKSMSIDRRLFVDDQCYEDLIQAAKNAREASGEEVSELSELSESDYSVSSETSHPRWQCLMPYTPSSEESDSV